MKYICKICNSIIDNNEICPFCGSDSTKIEAIEDDETEELEDIVVEEKLDANSNDFSFASDEVVEDDVVTEWEPEETEVEPEVKQKPVFEFCEGDDCENCCDDEDEVEENCSCACTDENNDKKCDCCASEDEADEHDEILDILVSLINVYGQLYKTDLTKAEKFERYLKDYILNVAVSSATEDSFKESLKDLENNEYFSEIIKQFR